VSCILITDASVIYCTDPPASVHLRRFALLLLKKVSPAAAVEGWVAGVPALRELEQE
jgi:hypothetical protein